MPRALGLKRSLRPWSPSCGMWVSGIQDQSCVSAGLVTGWRALESLVVI